MDSNQLRAPSPIFDWDESGSRFCDTGSPCLERYCWGEVTVKMGRDQGWILARPESQLRRRDNTCFGSSSEDFTRGVSEKPLPGSLLLGGLRISACPPVSATPTNQLSTVGLFAPPRKTRPRTTFLLLFRATTRVTA